MERCGPTCVLKHVKYVRLWEKKITYIRNYDFALVTSTIQNGPKNKKVTRL